jgi:hypothetical protein
MLEAEDTIEMSPGIPKYHISSKAVLVQHLSSFALAAARKSQRSFLLVESGID